MTRDDVILEYLRDRAAREPVIAAAFRAAEAHAGAVDLPDGLARLVTSSLQRSLAYTLWSSARAQPLEDLVASVWLTQPPATAFAEARDALGALADDLDSTGSDWCLLRRRDLRYRILLRARARSEAPRWLLDDHPAGHARTILQILWERAPDLVPLNDLILEMWGLRPEGPPLTAQKIIHVMICRIRRSLPAGWEIPRGAKHEGYRLVETER